MGTLARRAGVNGEQRHGLFGADLYSVRPARRTAHHREVQLDRTSADIPRAVLPEVQQREEVTRTGVYILWGPSENEEFPMAYVGEGETLLPRLVGHAKQKDFWDARRGLYQQRSKPEQGTRPVSGSASGGTREATEALHSGQPKRSAGARHCQKRIEPMRNSSWPTCCCVCRSWASSSSKRSSQQCPMTTLGKTGLSRRTSERRHRPAACTSLCWLPGASRRTGTPGPAVSW